MADNNSAQSGSGHYSSLRKINDKVILVQVLIAVFLYINILLIVTFSSQDFFRTNMRYIFFANTLLVDCLFLILTNILLILSYFRFAIPVWMCVIIYIMSSLCTFVTPLTLTAMTLERYVAICMPLRHGELCTPRSALHCILLIHSLSSIPTSVIVSIFFASVSQSFYTQYRICSVQIIIIEQWHGHLRSAISQLFFLLMAVPIVFSYVKIMKVARVASAESKKSTWKGLRTVTLHAFQLFLCLIQLWCPIIEAAVLQFKFNWFIIVRYVNYILFIIAPRCLSPLVYGLRDEKFFLVLRYYAFFGLNKNLSPVLVKQ